MTDPVVLLDSVSKSYPVPGGPRRIVLNAATIAFPAGRRVGILGPNGAGKSTLLRLIAGSEAPDGGRVHRFGRVSFPLGFSGSFHPELSGRENLRFMARIYGLDGRALIRAVEDFSELGRYMDAPVGHYSSGMMVRYAFAASLMFRFDVYLVDEATEVGDVKFRAKFRQAFSELLRSAALILVSHNSQTIRQMCDCCAVLHEGALIPFASVDEGLDYYADLMGVADA